MLFISHIQFTIESNVRDPEVTGSSFLSTRRGKLGPSSGTRLACPVFWRCMGPGQVQGNLEVTNSGYLSLLLKKE